MTVVLSYHRIVEREPAEVDSRWKSYTAILLLVIVASCLVLSFSLHGLLVDFKYNCLLDANLKFNLKANQTFGDGSNNPTISPFSNYTIDEYWSSWSDGAYCETLKYVPLLQGISSTIWLALFLIHGPGRIMPQPWRIVFPSLIYFFGCLVTSAVTASFITQGLAKFCTEFWQVDTKRDYSCAQYVVLFALTKEPSALVQGDKNFLLSLVFPWIWVGATCLGFLILLLRIVLMVDFQLMRVDILRHQS